jgi:hypothetical protein
LQSSYAASQRVELFLQIQVAKSVDPGLVLAGARELLDELVRLPLDLVK